MRLDAILDQLCGIYLIEKCCRVKSVYYERYNPMVFWEVGKLVPILRHHGDNINIVYPNPLQSLLGNENILNINIRRYMERSSKLVNAVFP